MPKQTPQKPLKKQHPDEGDCCSNIENVSSRAENSKKPDDTKQTVHEHERGNTTSAQKPKKGCCCG